MAAKGLQILYNLILKDVVKGSGQASGIMSIGNDVRKLADKKLQRYIDSAKKQGVDLNNLSEQQAKYMLELNRPKAPKVYSNEEAYELLSRFANQNKRGEVIKGKFGKPFAEEVVTVERVITDIKKLEPIEAMKEANRVLKGEGQYKSLSKADREKIAMDESVTDHIFERNIVDETEDFAQGGRTGLSYLLAEDINERMPLKDGHSPGRRKFLKIMGGLAALPVVGKLFKFAKPAAKVSETLTQVPIKSGVDGMPAWFKPLVNKVIKEGEDVTKQWAYKDRQIVHTTKLPDSQTDVLVTQDLDSGDVLVDIGLEKHGFADGKFGQPVRLEYKAKEIIEPDMDDVGKVKSKGQEVPEEFNVEEAEFTGGHPENVKFEESSVNKFGEHESDFSEVEAFATGKRKKDARKVSESLQKEGEDLADYFSNYPEPDDYASGGRVPLGKGKIVKGIMSLGKKKKKKLTADDVSQDHPLRRKEFEEELFGTKEQQESKKFKEKLIKKLEQYHMLKYMDTKGKKGHASGGLARMLGE